MEAMAAGVEAAGVVVAEVKMVGANDRVGLGWRPHMATQIITHLNQIDVLEVIADRYFSCTKKDIVSLQFMAAQIPISLHGTSMGLASAHPVVIRQVDKMARLVEKIKPDFWSEHLAFVRVGKIEIGHLAAAPRNAQTVDMTVRNLNTAQAIVGTLPHMENIATLIEPPGNSLSEAQWITDIIRQSQAPFLLDLHNLYANAHNFGCDPLAVLKQLPLDRIHTIHLSGGRWIKEVDGHSERLLDDHLHDVPPALYDLLAWVAEHASQDLTVIIERDGNYPDFNVLLAQLALARSALQKGRAASGVRSVYGFS